MLKPPLQPMLLHRKEQPFNSPDYLFEYKWDGFRCLLFYDGETIFLQSRNFKDLTPHFPELKQLQAVFKKPLILDGEICYFSGEDKSDFSVLQKRLSSTRPEAEKKYPVLFIAWDILAGEENIYNLPLRERKKLLKNVLPSENPRIQSSPYLQEKGNYLYREAKKLGLEGIVAKKIDSPYEFKRSPYWYKIKIWKYKNVFIGGYTQDKSALLVGEKNNNGRLNYRGKVKLSLPSNSEQALFTCLADLKTPESPFPEQLAEGNIWTEALIQVKVRYTELTSHHQFRHGYAVELVFN